MLATSILFFFHTVSRGFFSSILKAWHSVEKGLHFSVDDEDTTVNFSYPNTLILDRFTIKYCHLEHHEQRIGWLVVFAFNATLTAKKVCLNQVSNSQPPGHESNKFTTEPAGQGHEQRRKSL